MGSGAVITGELAKYFDEKFSVANAIARTGLSTGLIAMPLLIQFCIDVYGWRGTLLLVGGINLHCIVSGALLKPIPATISEFDDVDEEFQLQSTQLHSNHLHHQPSRDDNCATIKLGGCDKTYPPIKSAQTASHQSRDNCQRQSATIELRIDDTSSVKSAKTPTNESNQQNQRKCTLNLSYYLDLELFRDSIFVTRMAYIFGCGYCNTGWLIYLVPFAVTLGIPPYEAASLATFGGVGQLFGTLIFPLLTRQFSNTNILYLTSLLMCLALMLNPLFSILHSYVGLICSAVGFGLGRGSGLLANLQIAKENSAKSDKMTNVFTWLNVAYSVGSISSGFLSG